ncbi:MAG: hypothetical protein SCH70_10315 [Candidatus Methanoperedens sp.]|nr:hypothetical protein [Candidatus Methanoperedens sp.]
MDKELIFSIAISLFHTLESKNEFFDTKKNCVNYLSELYSKSYEKNYKSSPNYIMIYLWYSCAYIMHWNNNNPQLSSKISDLLDHTKEQLFKIEKRIGNPEFERLFKEAESTKFFPGYLEALNEFKLFYDKENKQHFES